MQIAVDVAGAQQRQRLGQKVGGDGRDHPQHQAAALPRLPHPLFQRAHFCKDTLCVPFQCPALRGQHDPRRGPLDQPRPHGILKGPNLHGQSRLRDMGRLGRSGEMRFLSQCQEIAQLAKRDVHQLS